MAYFIRKNTSTPTYGLVIFTVDEESDISTLPRYHAAGSTAYVIASGNTYMLNNKKEWILSNRAGGSGSGSGSGEGGGSSSGGSTVVPTPININIGADATASTDSQGNINIVINNKGGGGCCGGDTDIEWDDLSDGQDDPSSGGNSGGGCCGGSDTYWEGIGEEDPTPVNPDPTPVDPDPTPVDPDPTPVDPDPTPVEPDPEPEPETPNTVILKTGFGGARVNASVTKDYDLTALIPGTTYKVTGTGKGYYQNTLGENFDIDTTITVPKNYNEKTIIHLKKYNNQQNLVTGLEIKAGYNQVIVYYNGAKVTSQISASVDCTFEPVATKIMLHNARTLRNAGTPIIIEENEYYTLYDVINVGDAR